MNGRLKATLVGIGCLICCLPLIFTIVGTTSGLAGVWLGRYDLAIIGALGLVAVIAVAVRRNRAPSAPKAERDLR